MLSWAMATDRKFYFKSDDPLWHIQEYPKLCVFYMGASTTISIYTYTLLAFANFQSAAMTPICVSNISNQNYLYMVLVLLCTVYP
jgi:hypothetical protein